MTTTYIIIGRDPATKKLMITHNGKTDPYGDANVPDCVLDKHCRIDFTNGIIRLKNLDINNYTYVNGQAVESKTISRSDKIGLGKEQYLLDWQIINSVIPPETDIRPLQEIWNEYEQQNIKLQIKERKFNAIRSTTGLITMLAIALSLFTGRQSHWYLVLYAIAIVASIVLFIKAYRDSTKVPQQRNDLSKQFQRDYVCPKCGHFLGNQPYDILVQNHQCPYCRVKFIH